MPETGKGEAELVVWFMELWGERGWNQELAGKLLGMSQRHMSTWANEWKAAQREGRAIRVSTYSVGTERLRAFAEQVEEFGVEIGEIPPEQKSLVNQLVDFVTHPDTFGPSVSADDREKFALNRMERYSYTGPMRAYFSHLFNRWRGVEDRPAEGTLNGSDRRNTAAG